MAGHGSPPAPDKANHPGRQVGRPMGPDRYSDDPDFMAEGKALNAEPRDWE